MDKLDQPAKKRAKFEPKESEIEDSDDLEEIDYGDDDDDLNSDNQESYRGEEQNRDSKTKDTTQEEHENRGGETSNDHNLSVLDEDNNAESGQDGEQARDGDKTNAERCKYWPSCNAGDECSYYHPTKPCRAFPNCRFGSKCLYVHPPCKFNPNCARPGCPFAHPTVQSGGARRRAPGYFRALQQPLAPKCKYGFKCTNLMCKFSHQASEPCRFGANCLLETCPYTHPTDVARKRPASAFKWSAQS